MLPRIDLKAFIFSTIFAWTHLSYAGPNPDAKCDRPAAETGDMTAVWDCLRSDYKAADVELNSVYRDTLLKLKAKPDRAGAKKLEAEQTKWWKSKPKCLGEMEDRTEAMRKLSTCLDMTNDRLAELRALVKSR